MGEFVESCDQLLEDYTVAQLRALLSDPELDDEDRDHVRWVLRERGADADLAAYPNR